MGAGRNGSPQGALRVACVGAGYFARLQHEAWTRVAGARLVAICDRDRARAAEAAAAVPGAQAFDEAGVMIARLRPDILDIATPPESHLPLIRLAIASGLRRIMCQKPLAPTLDEARILVAEAAQAGARVVVHENFRFQPWHREAKRLIAADALGPIHRIAFRLRPGDGRGPRAYLDRQPYFQQMPRFLIHETGVHFVDVFRFLLGEVTAVSARLERRNPAIAGEDAGLVLFEFASGASGLFDGDRLLSHGSDNPRRTMGEMEIEGEAARLRLDGRGRLWLTPDGGAEREHAYAWRDEGFGGDCIWALQGAALAALRDGAEAENEAAAYLRNMEIVEAIYRAHGTCARVSV